MLNSHSGMPRISPGNPSGQGAPDLAHANTAVGAAITGIVLLGESANPMRLASLALIVLGIIGLKLSTH